MSRYSLSEEAKADLHDIKAYLLTEGGARVASYVLREIAKGFSFVAATPGAGHRREDLTSRPLRFWSIFSYMIIYDPATKPVAIARVLHARRDVSLLLRPRSEGET